MRRAEVLDDALDVGDSRRWRGGRIGAEKSDQPAYGGERLDARGLDVGEGSIRGRPGLGFLSAVVIPEFGGDTIWASTAAIYDALPSDVRQLCEESTVLHAPDASLLASVERHHGPEAANRLRRQHSGIEHPLVQTHPITGRKSLFLCPLYARRIVGPDGADGRLLARLHSMLDDPHIQVRWRWQAGDLAIWDETNTCHRALTDHYPQRRVMRRCVTARTG